MKISEMIKGRSGRVEQEIELPEVFPNMTDWAIYWFGDPTAIGSPPIPMIAKVTSGNPMNGQLNGIAFMDPGLKIVDVRGNKIQLPAFIPFAGTPYCSEGGKKLVWCTIDDFRALARAGIEEAYEQEQERESEDESHASQAPDLGGYGAVFEESDSEDAGADDPSVDGMKSTDGGIFVPVDSQE
jgi:hypothetical protein